MTKVISPRRIAVRLADDDLNPHDVNIPANTPVIVDSKLVRGLVALGASVVPEEVAIEHHVPDVTDATTNTPITSAGTEPATETPPADP